MEYRRSGQRDDRRRRVLIEDTLESVSVPSGKATPTVRRRRTTTGREMEGTEPTTITQRRLIDVIPTSYITLTLLLLGGAAIIAGLEALYYWMPRIAPMTSDGAVAALDLDNEGSLATWFSSATLGMASLVGLIVYWVRKQRADDYHGRYRIWLGASLCWLVMSIDEASSLHEGFKEMMTLATGWRIWGDGSLWWATPYALVLSVVGVRLLLDMRPARLPIAALLLAGGCYVSGVLAQLGLLIPDAPAKAIMLEEGAEMAGHLLLLFCMTVSARYMILDAQGLLTKRRRRVEEETNQSEPPAKRKTAKKRAGKEVHKPHASPPQPESDHRRSQRSSRRAMPQEAAPEKVATKAGQQKSEDPEIAEDAPRKLTRAQRKALRRQRRKERESQFDE